MAAETWAVDDLLSPSLITLVFVPVVYFLFEGQLSKRKTRGKKDR
jgi:hypothetical protein